MPLLVAAPDKFRGTASAARVAAAAARAARARGWDCDRVPMADGGEGTLEVVGGRPCHTVVHGPLDEPVRAEWRLLPGRPGGPGPTAVIEMARAAGRDLLPRPMGDQPLRAGTRGVGELVLAAARAGAGRIVVAVGGSATTDGGWGAVRALEEAGGPRALEGIELEVACDVTTPFRRAAEVFGPQKGAVPEQVAQLSARLDHLADRYRRDWGVDVDALAGAGAAGGLAGGLAALGARLRPGFELLAGLVDLQHRMEAADLVMTGEGRLDRPSLQGKVVGSVVALVAGRVPVLCVVGQAEPRATRELCAGPGAVEVVDLTARAGPDRARRRVAALVAGAVGDFLGRHGPAG